MTRSATAPPSYAGPLILALESSCDETAVAIADGLDHILASEISSQVELHRPYGGVVPELASRNHNLNLRPLIDLALEKAGVSIEVIDVFAATAGPGLASSLLIGNTTAKALALAAGGKPFYSINHMEGHLLSPFMGDPEGIRPCAALVVSGGHTLLIHLRGLGDYQLLGTTRDDAAGEAFDKVAKMLGLPYPGGPEIDRQARAGDPAAFDFPRSMIDSGDLGFSFSGLKTAMFYQLPKLDQPLSPTCLADLCASFQEAVVDVLVAKALTAIRQTGETLLTLSGGVSCNHRLREKMSAACEKNGIELKIAAPAWCTDNAAMIAYVAAAKALHGVEPSSLDEDVNPNLRLAD